MTDNRPNFVREFLSNYKNDQNTQKSKIFELVDKLTICNSESDRSLTVVDNIYYYSICDINNKKFLSLMRKFVNVKVLNCSGLNISDLSIFLPFRLKILNCSKCPIIAMDNILPGSLTILDCSGCNLRKIDVLPPNLVSLNCDDNNCEILSGLPCGLQLLSCKNNKLKKIDYLPPTLVELDCQNNRLTSLGFLHSNLAKINCTKNNLGFGDLYETVYSSSNKHNLILFLRKHATIYCLKNLNIDSNLCFIGIPVELINIIISDKAACINTPDNHVSVEDKFSKDCDVKQKNAIEITYIPETPIFADDYSMADFN